jgi:hypothetical protein
LGVGFRIIRPLNPPATDQEARYWEADSELLRQSVEDRMAEGRGVQGPVGPALAEKIRENQ